MQRIIYILLFLIITREHCYAQESIVFDTQPQWTQGINISGKCLFYEDNHDTPLNFDEVRKQLFVPFDSSLINHRTNKPLLIQWYTFSISNRSVTDTIHLKVTASLHYFSRLYSSEGLIAKSGIYETSVPASGKGNMPLMVEPSTTKTFWLRTEDRQGHILPPVIWLDTQLSFVSNFAAGQHTNRLIFLLLSMLTGCLLFITLFAAYHYYLYRDKVFLWYIAYTGSSVLTGLFWIDIRLAVGIFSSFFHDLIFSIFLFLIPVMYGLFIGNMLKIKNQFKKTWFVVKILMAIATAQMLIELITFQTGHFIFNEYFNYFVSIIPVAILNILLLVLTALSKEKVKWFMFGGLLSMLLLWCLPMLVFPNITIRFDAVTMVLIFVPFYFLLGLTIEAICFSFALSYRSKLILIEKNNLQHQYSLQLEDELAKRTSELAQQNKISEAQKIKQVQAAFEKKIAETEMTALRAQMNPHFIFNCLNSIKLYTLENDSKTASEYLTIFSQLIRLVLENSHSEKISLKKELETLRLYIELEAMRFKDKVHYEISVAPEIDQEYTEIPPLLIQPYVENAIWHGLMHKRIGGTIHIHVTQDSADRLLVEVSDDGVGRQQAAAYKSKTATKNKSYGLKMTSERISIINQLYNMDADVEITDLTDAANNPTGTKVKIKIPV